jgi:hypothetical protein
VTYVVDNQPSRRILSAIIVHGAQACYRSMHQSHLTKKWNYEHSSNPSGSSPSSSLICVACPETRSMSMLATINICITLTVKEQRVTRLGALDQPTHPRQLNNINQVMDATVCKDNSRYFPSLVDSCVGHQSEFVYYSGGNQGVLEVISKQALHRIKRCDVTLKKTRHLFRVTNTPLEPESVVSVLRVIDPGLTLS